MSHANRPAVPTARALLETGCGWQMTCSMCAHSAPLDLTALVADGRGDRPLSTALFRCSKCGAKLNWGHVIDPPKV